MTARNAMTLALQGVAGAALVCGFIAAVFLLAPEAW